MRLFFVIFSLKESGDFLMALVKPFRALRPKKELVSQVASPPYDVLDSIEARTLSEGNPYSFLHVNKPEIDLEIKVSPYDEQVYKKGAENFNKMCQEKVLIQDEKPYFYVYRQIMGTHKQIGLVACASVNEYERNIIKKHELTRQDKEDDRVKHMRYLKAQVGPVFLTYRQKNSIDKIIEGIILQRPENDFLSENVQHTFWLIKNKQTIEQIIQEFSNVDFLYVADGHHRSAAALRMRNLKRDSNKNHNGEENYNYFLTVIFPDNQMQILDYNRVIKDLHHLSKEDFLKSVKKNFTIQTNLSEKEVKPDCVHVFSMYLDRNWYKLTAKANSFDANDPVKRLDVSILQENLLHPILGIDDPRKDKRIDFIGGIRGLKELEKRVDSKTWRVAFALYPTSIEELMTIADAGKTMPPKSTWFEPKLKSGLFIHVLDE
jgi:uncharacterized protein (DUF1015 family)